MFEALNLTPNTKREKKGKEKRNKDEDVRESCLIYFVPRTSAFNR